MGVHQYHFEYTHGTEFKCSVYFQVRSVRVEKRINEIVNRLNKTKVEKHPDFRAEREERDHKEREAQKRVQQELKLKEKDEERRRKEQAELR